MNSTEKLIIEWRTVFCIPEKARLIIYENFCVDMCQENIND